ncbi:hypothetical protein BH18ACT9_BH18ACT9_07810 [soil metagenome]
MNSTVTRYQSADRPLSAVLDVVPAESWTTPSTCEGWAVRDVLGHMIETQRDFLTGHGLDLGGAPDLSTDPRAAWREHAQRVLRALADDDVPMTAYDGHFGPTTVGATLEQFYVWDMLVHRWDIATSVGADARLSDAELDRLEAGADSFGEALYLDGVCQPAIEAPEGADRQARLLARLGRRA